jgi:DNA-directed RNA polymerase specialized sigma24 family protein
MAPTLRGRVEREVAIPHSRDDGAGAAVCAAEVFGSNTQFVPLLKLARGTGPEADAALEDLLTALCDPIRHHVSKILSHNCADRSDASQDAVQEALIRIARGVRGCHANSDGQLLEWVRVTTRHTVIEMHRSPASGLAARQFSWDFDEEMRNYAASQGDDAPEPSSEAMRVLLEVVMAAYNDAVDATGELLWWRLIVGLEFPEIASEMSVTHDVARKRFQRAKLTLQREIGRRIELLAEPTRQDILSLLTRFGYGDAVAQVCVEPDTVYSLSSTGDIAVLIPLPFHPMGGRTPTSSDGSAAA